VDYRYDFLTTFIKAQTLRTLSNKTLILNQMMKIESLEAGAQDGSEGQAEGQTIIQDDKSIQDEIALYEVKEAEESDDFIKEYVLNDRELH